jgi:hypothetical protein
MMLPAMTKMVMTMTTVMLKRKSDNQFDHDFQDDGSVYFCKLQKCATVMAGGQKWTYLFSSDPIV